MPRLTNSAPKYRKHKASGQAIVKFGGRDYFLGPYGSKASRVEFDRLVGEWIANGRQPGSHVANTTVLELVAGFWRHAQKHYVKNGRPTAELAGMKVFLRYLRQMYGDIDVMNFRPLCLQAIRERMIAAGNSRRYINQNC